MDDQEPVGQVIDGRYRLDKLLGRGGMGAVYLGYHINVGRRVAVKILRSSAKVEHEDVLRFHREARAAAAIGHKGIVDILDVGTTAWGDSYLVMEHLEGESLATLLDRLAPFDLFTATAIGEQLLLALAAAHDKGIIHRDITPGNIFLVYEGEASRPAVKLIDFGVSKIAGATGVSTLTQAGTFLGTPAYVAPEQAMADASVDHRADLYSVGVVVYEMLTGDVPFTGRTFNALILNIVSQPPRPPHEVNPSFPSEAAPFLYRAMDKRPEARFQTATEMLEALRALCSLEARERGLGKLTSVLSRSHCAWGDLGGEPDSRFSDPPSLPAFQGDRFSQETQSASQPRHRLRLREALRKTTRRFRALFGVSVVVVVALLFFVGFLILERDPVVLTPQGGTAPVELIPTALKAHFGPPVAQEPEPPKTTPEATSDDSVEQPAAEAGKRATPKPKHAGDKRSAKAKHEGRPDVSSDVPKFIQGGRQTEIAKDFE